jgi:Na+/H+ antiporter NhaA
MALFFFTVGLEIKREILVGELSTPKKALLPVIAALGGIVVFGLIYATLNAGHPTIDGWGVPVATDIAFALGALALLGRRLPVGLRIFLAALAIADDLGAVVIIALLSLLRPGLPLCLKKSGGRIYWGGMLAGIGFTVSLFISELSFVDPQVVDYAKISILSGSVISATIGISYLGFISITAPGGK